MKKKLIFAMSAIVALFATSCQEEDFGVSTSATSTVAFTVSTPEIASRAYSDGTTATKLQYAVYDADGNELTALTKTDATINGSATVDLQLTTGNKYSVIFWAAAPNAPYTVDFAKKTMTVNYDGAVSNAENRDAFYKYHTFTVTGAQTETIELKRPFAQLNIGTNDYAASTSAGYNPTQSSVKVSNVYKTLDFVEGKVSDGVEVNFALTEIKKDETFPVAGHEYLAMNYLLVDADKELVDIEFTYADANNDAKSRTVGSVPVQRNYRTNIYGQLLTSDVDINIEIKPEYEDPAHGLVSGNYSLVANRAELQAALDKEPTGIDHYIYFTDNIEGDVTDIQKPGRKVIIDGRDYKYNGTIKVHSNSNYYADAALTIKNLNFETSTASVNFIEALENGSERYSCNITVENCTFTATGEAVNTAVGVQIKSSKNAQVIGCTATNMHSLIQAQSCDESVLVQGCTVNGKNGVAFKQVRNAVVEGTTITAAAYGIRFDGNTDNYGITVKENIVTAAQPFIVRKMTGQNNTITLEGTNTLTTEAEYQIVITNGSDDEEYVKPTGTYTLTGADAYTVFPALPVAKIGTTEYTSIDEAIANWTNGTTLTLIANVTLNDVITLKSTEYHILNLGTYTLTAAKGKDAISISNEGRSKASYALDIKADENNIGGITATSKAVVKTTGKSGVQDRPIIRFYNGVYNASNVISHSGSSGTNCPQFQFHNGIFNGSISTNRALIQIYGGTFNGRFYASVDSSAYMLISGGKFKYLDNLYGSALNSDKFTIGSSKGNYDRGIYVDDEGYFVVGGAVITEFGDMFAAKATNASKAGSYLPYSSAAANGLYYTNAQMAIDKHGEANVVLK